MDPAQMDDDALAAHMTTLTDGQLADLCDRLDAAEIISKTKTVDMGKSAAWYANKLRWPVFPLKPRGKKPLTDHGFKDASTDPGQISAWWEQWPDANIGVPTGSTGQGGCGYDVIDIDGPDGIRAWGTIKHSACEPGCSDITFCPAPGPFDIRALAYTPGNGVDRGPGRHLFIPATGKGNATRVGGVPIDYRGAGGYVVAAPSVGLNGQRYGWLHWPVAP